MKPIQAPFQFGSASPPWLLSQLDAFDTAVAAALNDTLTYGNYLVDTSPNPNSITASPAAGVTVSYTAGLHVQVKMANSNTGAVTANIGSNGSVPVTQQDGTPLVGAQLLAGAIYDLCYDGAKFQVVGAVPNAGNSPINFTTNFTGAFVGPIGLSYYITGPEVTVYCHANIIGNSNLSAFLNFSIPSQILPSTQLIVPGPNLFVGPNPVSFSTPFTCVIPANGAVSCFAPSVVSQNTQFGFARGVMFSYILE